MGHPSRCHILIVNSWKFMPNCGLHLTPLRGAGAAGHSSVTPSERLRRPVLAPVMGHSHEPEMKTIEIRILSSFLALIIIGCFCLILGLGPDFWLPKIPLFFSTLYGGLRWIIAVGMMFAVPAFVVYVFVRYMIHAISSSSAPFLPGYSWGQKALVAGAIVFVMMGSLFVWILVFSVDFGN